MRKFIYTRLDLKLEVHGAIFIKQIMFKRKLGLRITVFACVLSAIKGLVLFVLISGGFATLYQKMQLDFNSNYCLLYVLVDSGFFEGVKKVLHVGEVKYSDIQVSSLYMGAHL